MQDYDASSKRIRDGDGLIAQEECQIKKAKLEVADDDQPNPVPESIPTSSSSGRPPAKTFPFELDPFQKEAIAHLENEQNVLVTAHTSAGKTVIAEYAIAMAMRDGQKVIYTSPIKALSNQKFGDLTSEFTDVGLMTGDITRNRNASCMVMTTEILRNFLFRGHAMLQETKYVIFDEVHYMRDRDRGVVWEESIIMLNPNINLVFLSATLPNATEFADWIAMLKGRPCHVISTDVRPVPLRHFVFPAGGSGLYLVKDADGPFQKDKFERSLDAFCKTKSEKQGQVALEQGGVTDIRRVIELLFRNGDHPIICFCFSRRETEARALELSKLGCNNEEEAALVEEIYTNALESLTEEDRQIPQLQLLLPLLKRGVGVHHSGLLAIVKEVVEILFQESLIKVLFATETFSMGVNMPAKTVVFTQIQKFDGKQFRWLKSSEYIQMSGRAGRRNKDKRGICIMMTDERLSVDDCARIIGGASDPLSSSFYVSYPMVLNLLRADFGNPDEVIAKSFMQYLHFCKNKGRQKRIVEMEQRCVELDSGDRKDDLEEYMKLLSSQADMKDELRKMAMKPVGLIPFLQPGRIIYVEVKDPDKQEEDSLKVQPPCGAGDWGWGVLVSFRKRHEPDKYMADVLLKCGVVRRGQVSVPEPPVKGETDGEENSIEIVRVYLDCVTRVSAARVYMPSDLRSPEAREGVFKAVEEVKEQFPEEPFGLPLLDPVTDLEADRHCDASKLQRVREAVAALDARLADSVVAALPAREREALEAHYSERQKLEESIRTTQRLTEHSQTKIFRGELKNKMRVLRRLGHVDSDGVVQLKGKIACFVDACDTLVLTELIFDGLFTDLDAPETVAVLSCLLEHEKVKTKSGEFNPKLQNCFQKIKDAAALVLRVTQESRIEIDEDKFLEGFRDDMMEICHAWCSGKPFIDVCSLSDMFEGSIVRHLRRLHELVLNLVEAAKEIGNSELEEKFTDAITAMKRGIVFAASLYLGE
eukprot:895114_1